VLKSKPKTRWSREFKLRALAQMDEAPDVSALAKQLGVQRELLYIWRRKFRSGGAAALLALGQRASSARPFDATSAAASPETNDAGPRRIAELERKVGQQQLELDFFRTALRHVREQRLKKGDPGETPSTR
jgi:transposase-like protein